VKRLILRNTVLITRSQQHTDGKKLCIKGVSLHYHVSMVQSCHEHFEMQNGSILEGIDVIYLDLKLATRNAMF